MIQTLALGALARRFAPVGILAAGVVALLTFHSCSVDNAEKRGGVAQDVKWQGAQTQATNTATAVKRVTQAAGRAVSLRVGKDHDQEIAKLRSDAAVLRDGLRRARADRDRAARSADLPCGVGTAGELARLPCAQLAALEAANDSLAATLIDIAEEGEGYRLQVLGWQDWWTGQEEAIALGQQVAPLEKR